MRKVRSISILVPSEVRDAASRYGNIPVEEALRRLREEQGREQRETGVGRSAAD